MTRRKRAMKRGERQVYLQRSKGDSAERLLARLEGRCIITIEHEPDGAWTADLHDFDTALDYSAEAKTFAGAVRKAFHAWAHGGDE